MSTVEKHGEICLLGLMCRGRIRLVTGILRLVDVGHVPKLILVVGCFNKHGIPDLTVSIAEAAVADVTLESLPHDYPAT